MLRRLRDELDAGRFSLARTLAEVSTGSNAAVAADAMGVTLSELRRCASNLEITFVLRLFAEFEGVLRDFWQNGLKKDTEPNMRGLMASIARQRKIDDTTLNDAHLIREYRNDITHENLRDPRISFSQCLSGLNRFIAWLPLQW